MLINLDKWNRFLEGISDKKIIILESISDKKIII